MTVGGSTKGCYCRERSDEGVQIPARWPRRRQRSPSSMVVPAPGARQPTRKHGTRQVSIERSSESGELRLRTTIVFFWIRVTAANLRGTCASQPDFSLTRAHQPPFRSGAFSTPAVKTERRNVADKRSSALPKRETDYAGWRAELVSMCTSRTNGQHRHGSRRYAAVQKASDFVACRLHGRCLLPLYCFWCFRHKM